MTQVREVDTTTAPAPFVAVGLVMMLTFFAVIVTRRRLAIARRTRPLVLTVAVAERRTPERMFS